MAEDRRRRAAQVNKKIAQIRDLMGLAGTMPYSRVRAWALESLPGRRGKTPRTLILSGLLGLGGLLTDLQNQDDFSIL